MNPLKKLKSELMTEFASANIIAKAIMRRIYGGYKVSAAKASTQSIPSAKALQARPSYISQPPSRHWTKV